MTVHGDTSIPALAGEPDSTARERSARMRLAAAKPGHPDTVFARSTARRRCPTMARGEQPRPSVRLKSRSPRLQSP